jgi:thiosulfate/3-mercaptopyruvate sulfurtransferase
VTDEAEQPAADDPEQDAPLAEPRDAHQPLVSPEWLLERLSDSEARIVHVSLDRKVYEERHIPGAVFADLHQDLAKAGRVPETANVDREYLVPDLESVEDVVRRWGVGSDNRVVFYDDAGQNRHAIRGYWLLRYYGFPRDRLHVLDGGLTAWERAGGPLTADEPETADPGPIRLPGPQPDLIATAEQVLDWSRDTTGGGPPRVLDVRSHEEFEGTEVRSARGGHVPGAVHVPFTDFLREDNTLRPAGEIRAVVEQATAGQGCELRASYCQGGVRAALAWFALHELAGLDVRNYANSWEEWGNRDDLPVESASSREAVESA